MAHKMPNEQLRKLKKTGPHFNNDLSLTIKIWLSFEFNSSAVDENATLLYIFYKFATA